MKKISMIALLAFSLLVPCGCKETKIQVIQQDTVVTNTVPMKAFTKENYIWESWQFSTNTVKEVK